MNGKDLKWLPWGTPDPGKLIGGDGVKQHLKRSIREIRVDPFH